MCVRFSALLFSHAHRHLWFTDLGRGQLEAGVFEFRDPKLEREAGLTPADRKWMDDIVRDVNDGWDESDPAGGAGIQ